MAVMRSFTKHPARETAIGPGGAPSQPAAAIEPGSLARDFADFDPHAVDSGGVATIAGPWADASDDRESEESDDAIDNDRGDGDDGNDNDDGHGGGRGDGGENVRWITIAAYAKPIDAQMARLRLEAEGIDCILLDENLVATDWLLFNAVGGIKLQVPEDLAMQAAAVLRPASHANALQAGGVGDNHASEHCPTCGSLDVAELRLPMLLALLFRLFRHPPPIARQCGRCGREWSIADPALPP
jgi:hypothetical protein